MFGDMQEKLLEMQQKLAEAKKKLDEISIDAQAGEGAVKVTVTANRKFTDVRISDEIWKDNDKDALEDLLLTAINRGLEEATKVSEAEMQGTAKGILPNIPGI